ncbi:MAG: carbon dioxide concentrating mechanism protein [Leptolyngbyaceae cyanobacterium CRU_2_3]|nr:carbon dioxide concentrating mechanism protein [Leptolyngbyaceae cyanobacterium CRU_2_3]
MRSPSPALINDTHFFVSGNVTIHPTAAIAPGVMLQADPHCQLVIGAGTCVGIGSILHAHQGNLVVEAGVTLGSGVLIVGNVTIGSNACIGSTTTILNRSIESQQLVAAGSLIGDDSRQVDWQVSSQTNSPAGSAAGATSSSQPAGNTVPPQPTTQPTQPTQPAVPPFPQPSAAPNSDSPATPNGTQPGTTQVVYGRAYLERIMVTMFPHRQASESPVEPPVVDPHRDD